MQNAIGDFHQDVLGAVYSWENLGIGGGLDILNSKTKVVAEIKNKFNTTKGNHRIEIYDSIKAFLSEAKYKNFTGYFVEIIPQRKQVYDKPFTLMRRLGLSMEKVSTPWLPVENLLCKSCLKCYLR